MSPSVLPKLNHSRNIRSIYIQIHAAGVLHNDVQWRHVRCSDDKVFVIDFGNARLREEFGSEQGWEAAKREEMIRLEMMLDMN